MDPFEYLSVLLSIVLGLGITQLLSGFARWLELRRTVRAYTPTLAWAGFLLIVHVQTWWAMFGLRHWPTWSFQQFAIVLLQPIILFLMAALVFPGAGSEEQDLKTRFFAHRGWFFGLLFALLAVSVAKDVVRSGALPGLENLAFHAGLAALGIVGLATRRDLVQRLVALTALALISAYVLLLFANLA